MSRCLGICLAVLALASSSWAAEIEVAKQVQPNRLVEYTVTPPGKSCAHFVLYNGDYVYVRVDSGNPNSACFTGPPGLYNLMAVVVSEDGKLEQTQKTVTIGDILPPAPPTPPNPPTPPAPPTPPKPEPVTGPAGVMVLFQGEELQKYPPAQRAILFSTKLRTYLWNHCSVTDTKPDARFYDMDTKQFQQDSPMWAKARETKAESMPWLVIFDPKTNEVRYSGPLGANEDETLATCRKYLEAK